MVKSKPADVRACQVMEAMQQRVPGVSYDARLAETRKALRQEFPGMRNLTRFITRALQRHHEPSGPPTEKSPGPVPLSTRATSAELRVCCRAVKAGQAAHGERQGIRWTPSAIRKLPSCRALMTKYRVKDARTVMTALRAHDPSIKLTTPRVKPSFTTTQMANRFEMAINLQERCKQSASFHAQTFMLDEAHSYISQLLQRRTGRVVIPRGATKQCIYKESRRTAGAVDRTCLARLVVINPCAGPVSLTWLRPTPGAALRHTRVSKG
jgi:hypothetical protein